jgi:ABC-2 type transport system permease protein
VAVFLASLGLVVSCFAASNRVSLSLSLFVLLAFLAPTQLPAGAQQAWAGDLLLRVNPLTAGERYVSKIVVNGHGWTEDLSWLLSPVIGALVFATAAVLVSGRYIRLRGGVSG